MPTVSQTTVFLPKRYFPQAVNNAERPPQTITREIPPEELFQEQTTTTEKKNTNIRRLAWIPEKSSLASILAKVLLGAIVLIAAAASVAIPFGVSVSRASADAGASADPTTTVTTVTTTSATTTTTTTRTTTTTTTTVTTTTTAMPVADAFWAFDSNTADLYNTYNANGFGSPTYVASYLGIGNAISLTRTSSQYAAVTSTQLRFNASSFTIQAWIYPIGITTADHAIFGQCQAATTNLCMFFILRNLQLCCGFWNNDLLGSTAVTMNRWSHVACVYNLATQTQQVWLNGVLDGSRSSTPYAGSVGHTTIGVGYLTPPGSNFFNGYFDQMRFALRAKNSTEMLNDATLVVYYSFDGGSLFDNGPNGINATATGSPTMITGRVNQALQLGSGAYIANSYPALYMMGIATQPFTISLWVRPTGALNQSTIVFAQVVSVWCIGFITMQNNGQIMLNSWNGASVPVGGPNLVLNVWTHIGYTYSTTNGIRLYVNGTQFATSGSFTMSASGTSLILTLGSNLGLNGCSPYYGGSFNGGIDEFYIFSRELTAAQMLALANP